MLKTGASGKNGLTRGGSSSKLLQGPLAMFILTLMISPAHRDYYSVDTGSSTSGEGQRALPAASIPECLLRIPSLPLPWLSQGLPSLRPVPRYLTRQRPSLLPMRQQKSQKDGMDDPAGPVWHRIASYFCWLYST